jgi:small-conductance mechanosensitive channel
MLEQVSFKVGKQTLDLWMLMHGAVTVGITLLIALWFASLIESRLLAAEQMDGNVREVLARLAKAILSVIALLCSLSLVGIDVTTLSVFSGALAVGLGFGLQKIASNYVSGFIILLDRSIRLGNLVAVDDKTSGTVTQITTRYTVLRTLSGTEVIIPNEYLVSNIIRNHSFTDTRIRVVVSVQVAYDTDLDKAMPLMAEAARQHPRVLADPAPGVLLTEFAESGISLELGFWVPDPEAGTGNVRSDISLVIWKAFREHGIEIPCPQREVRLLGAMPTPPEQPA